MQSTTIATPPKITDHNWSAKARDLDASPPAVYGIAFPEPGVVKVQKRRLAPLGPDEFRVQALFSAVSPGTERAQLMREFDWYQPAKAPGYCHIGRVVEVGAQVKDTVNVGDMVYSQGPHQAVINVKSEEHIYAVVPPGVPPHHAALTTLAAIGKFGMEEGQLQKDETVLIIGDGPIGLFAAYFANRLGAFPVVLAGHQGARLAVSKEVGVHYTINTRTDSLAEAREKLGLGDGFAVIINATASLEALREGMAQARQQGRVVQLGTLPSEVQFPAFPEWQRKGLTLIAVHQPNHDRIAQLAARAEILGLMQSGQLNLAPLFQHIPIIPFNQAPIAYRLLSQAREQYLGAVLDWRNHDRVSQDGDQRRNATTTTIPDSPPKAPQADNGQSGETANHLDRTSHPRHSLGKCAIYLPDKLGVAIIGVGTMGSRHTERYASRSDVDVIALCDAEKVQAQAVAEQFGISQVYTDWQETLHHPGVDAVSICVPNALHAPISIAALEAGKHVLCEKPMARTLDEARQILQVAQRTSGILRVGYLLRHWLEAAILRELIATGMLGQIFYLHGCNSHPARPPEHLTQEAAGGGVLLDLGGHLLDLAQYCLGDFRPLSVDAHLIQRTGLAMEDGAWVRVTLAGGTVFEMRTAWQAPTWERSLRVWGERGEAAIRPLRSTIRLNGTRLALQPCQAKDPNDPLQGEIDAFVATCRGQETPGCDGRAAYLVQAVIAAAYQSAELGRRVSLDEVDPVWAKLSPSETTLTS